jgi:hypothetical protein
VVDVDVGGQRHGAGATHEDGRPLGAGGGAGGGRPGAGVRGSSCSARTETTWLCLRTCAML